MLPLPFVLFIYDFLSSKKVGSIVFTKPKDIAMVCSFKLNCRPTWQTNFSFIVPGPRGQAMLSDGFP